MGEDNEEADFPRTCSQEQSEREKKERNMRWPEEAGRRKKEEEGRGERGKSRKERVLSGPGMLIPRRLRIAVLMLVLTFTSLRLSIISHFSFHL